MEPSITQKHLRKSGQGRWALVLFGLVFFLAGSGFFYAMAWPMIRDGVASRSWAPVPCVILSSEVITNSDSDGDTHKVQVRYRYMFNGQEYFGNRYGIITMASSGYKSKAAVVGRLPAGTETTCYVNPANPLVAVISREVGWDALFSLIPVLFMLVGAGIIYGGFRTGRSDAKAPQNETSGRMFRQTINHAPSLPQWKSGPVVLTPASSTKALFTGLLIVALFWNGIVVGIALSIFKASRVDTCAAVFISVFILVGLFILGAAVKAGLALMNPKPTLTLSQGYLHPGESAQLKWTFTGQTDRIHHLSIYLEGQEEAKYRRGTDTVTDKHTFATIPIADTSRAMDIAAGKATVVIPAGAMHTFESEHNKIRWVLIFHGEIQNWPDVKLEFPLKVLPQGA